MKNNTSIRFHSGTTAGFIHKNNSKKDKANSFTFKQMLLCTLPSLFPEIPAEELSGFQDYIEHLLSQKGKEYVLRYLKATQESVEGLVLQTPGILEHDKVSIGKDCDGWPKWLGTRLKSKCLQTGDISSIRFVLTLCSARRLITVPTYTHLDSITKPPVWTTKVDIRPLLDRTENERKVSLKEGLRNPALGSDGRHQESVTSYKIPKHQISLKSSPNGVSFFSFPWDRAAVVSHDLIDKLEDFASTYFTGDVSDWLYDLIDPYEDLAEDGRTLNVGKISLTYETGKLKPRVFAIVDSVTQTLLGDLHQDLMSILRNISEDCTFDQDKVSEVARREALKSEPFYGFADLSNATDAIPLYLYEDLGNWLRPKLGTAWVGLFDRWFTVSKSVHAAWTPGVKQKTHVKYKTGQPMGALSSWPFMALVHHVLVWYSFGSERAAKGKYLILGDDVVIFDREAYEKYINVLDILGVTYTHHISTFGFEFAKRSFFKGTEITGAYTQALWASRTVPELFAFEWRNLASRGYKIGPSLPDAFRPLFKVSKSRFRRIGILLSVPFGTEISLERLSNFAVSLSGRSVCLLSSTTNDARLVESVKALRQAASLLIKQRFQDELNAAKQAVQDNKETYLAALKIHSGLCDKYNSVMQTAYQEVIEEQTTRIRYLERDLKLMFLNPTDKTLLRPQLEDMPRRIDFSMRDEHLRKMRIRAAHQLSLISLLSG